MKRLILWLVCVLIGVSALACDLSSIPTTITTNPVVTSTTTSVLSTTLTSATTALGIAPRIDNLSVQSGTSAGSIVIAVSALTPSTVIRYLLTVYDAPAPTVEEVFSGTDYDDVDVVASGSATHRLYKTIDGLSEDTIYMAHIVLEDKGVSSEVVSRRAKTKNLFEAGTYGTGIEEDPFQIHSVWQLELIATDEYGYTASAHYKLINDIDMADGGYGQGLKSWVPIGKQNGLNRKFTGVFDGDGYTIKNLYIDTNAGTEKWGLFQETAPDSAIRNLHLTDVFVRVNGFRIAALVGYAKGHINNVSVTNAIIEQTGGEGQVGAIVGAYYDTGSLYKAYSDATVIGTGRRVGGLVGAATTNAGFDPVWIADVSFTGSVSGVPATARQYGGILGAGSGVLVSRAYASAAVDAVRQVGGLVGYLEGIASVTSTLRDSVYAGPGVSASGIDGNTTVAIGLVLGDASITKGPYEVINSYSSLEALITTVGSPSSRQTSGTRVSLSELGLVSFYQANLPTWSFLSTWSMSDASVPTLRIAKKSEGAA